MIESNQQVKVKLKLIEAKTDWKLILNNKGSKKTNNNAEIYNYNSHFLNIPWSFIYSKQGKQQREKSK